VILCAKLVLLTLRGINSKVNNLNTHEPKILLQIVEKTFLDNSIKTKIK